MVHCVIRAYCEINRTAVWPIPGISVCSNKYKTKNLGVLNNVMFIQNRVVLIEAGSLIEAGGSDTIHRSRGLLLQEIRTVFPLIEAPGFYGAIFYANCRYSISHVSLPISVRGTYCPGVVQLPHA